MALPVSTLSPVCGPDLRAARLAAGLTQVQLAQLSGLTQSWIARIEAGSVPHGDVAYRIRRALALSTSKAPEALRAQAQERHRKLRKPTTLALRISQELYDVLTMESLESGVPVRLLVRGAIEEKYAGAMAEAYPDLVYKMPLELPPVKEDSKARQARRKRQQEEEDVLSGDPTIEWD